MYICPSDIMHLDQSMGKAYNIEPDLCWECYACVKTCPQTAIDMRGYGDVMPMGASLTPLRGTDSILWTVKFRNGEMKRFKYPIRTTPWGSIEPFQDLPDPSAEEANKAGLCGEAKYLGVDKLPVLSND
jgi:adenylylsulfate reductase subunit B